MSSLVTGKCSRFTVIGSRTTDLHQKLPRNDNTIHNYAYQAGLLILYDRSLSFIHHIPIPTFLRFPTSVVWAPSIPLCAISSSSVCWPLSSLTMIAVMSSCSIYPMQQPLPVLETHVACNGQPLAMTSRSSCTYGGGGFCGP